MTQLLERVKEVMENNRRTKGKYKFTIPSPELYPFQWLWDSCFHAIILSHFDINAAKAELRSVVSSPLKCGMLPHIIYRTRPEDVPQLWGREQRGDIITSTWGVLGTSSITQPTLLAFTLRKLYDQDQDRSLLKDIYPILRKHFIFLDRERTVPSFGPLLAIINPDESGEDNSPRFDEALGLAPMHVPDAHLDARLGLMKHFTDCQFKVNTCMQKFFSVIDLPFNVLYAEDLEHLAYLAEVLRQTEDARMFSARAVATRKAIIQHLYRDKQFQSYDATNQMHIKVNTWAKFMPLYGGLITKKAARELIFTELLNPDKFGTEFPVPTTSVSEPAFDPINGFWRGPTWMAPNWFIYHGLKRYGFTTHAENIKTKSIALIEQSGFREQYNPLTGEGQGGTNFTWGGLVLDMN
jgi:hypothetical protein